MLFGLILQTRALCAALAGASVLHVGLQLAGLEGWRCPAMQTFGLPCPGCGLSRACAALVRGDWLESFQLHAFAPVVLFGMTLITLGAVLPKDAHRGFVRLVSEWERRTAITPLLLGAFCLYWLLRFASGAAAA
ncbi:MAG TPA: DUF2752 domain-containing protein [Chthoniobacteraceae bacterium]|nr:DUF2752 domain-containing protein [Chthoniobacteraceae bacterium]